MKIDLHSHSIHSDGTKSPKELLELAKNKGLEVYAITDHDDIDGSKILINSNHEGIKVYSGVELNAKVDKGQMHILGYNFDLYNQELNQRLKELKEHSIENIKLYIKQLEEDFNIILPPNEIEELLNKVGNIGRPQLALILVKYNYCKTVREAFDKYLKDDKVRKIKKSITKEECISLINNAGGIAVLAHPWSLKLTDEELYQEIKYLSSIGLKGIEVYHSCNTKEQIEYYKELAKEFNLLTTGGTDYHGKEVKPDIELGSGVNNNVDINLEDITLPNYITSRYE